MKGSKPKMMKGKKPMMKKMAAKDDGMKAGKGSKGAIMKRLEGKEM